MEIPGSDFASYRWGTTLDPITPFLTDRPYVVRELEPHGSAGLMNLLFAFDGRLQDQVLEQERDRPGGATAERGRSRLPRRPADRSLQPDRRAPDLALPHAADDPTGPGRTDDLRDEPRAAVADPEDRRSRPRAAPRDTRPARRSRSSTSRTRRRSCTRTSANGSLIVSGDGSGLVDLGGLGALDDSRLRPVLGVLLQAPSRAAQGRDASPDAVLVVTDSNRKRPERWGIMSVNTGATERATETRSEDRRQRPAGRRLPRSEHGRADRGPVARRARHACRATAVTTRCSRRCVARGRSTATLDTSWQTGSYTHVLGDKIRLDLDSPIETDQVRLVQSLVGRVDRYITRATLTFDGKDPVTVDLTGRVAHPRGSDGRLPDAVVPSPRDHRRRHERRRCRADRLHEPGRASPRSAFATRPTGAQDIRVDEIVRLPTDLVDALGTSAAGHALVFSIEPFADQRDPAPLLAGRGRVDPPDPCGRRPHRSAYAVACEWPPMRPTTCSIRCSASRMPQHGGLTVRASIHLPGDVAARGSAAFDGNPATAWSTAYCAPAGQWVEFDTPKPVTMDHFDLQVVADGRHSVPTQMRIDAGDDSRIVDLPAGRGQHAARTRPCRCPCSSRP